VSLRHDIRACQNYTDACTRIAARAADAKTRDDLRSLQRSWLRLEGCLAFAARLLAVRIFSNAADRTPIIIHGSLQRLPTAVVLSGICL
jgi:hypothetical protein